jgi:predicted TIM-barrel fold metal-dependent hydrolase
MNDTPDCPGPWPHTVPPATRAPAGACDSHFHVFGPYARYPLASQRSYTPPEAALHSYERMADTLNLQRAVIVQPSIYGTDNRCMLDALEALGSQRARAVAVLDDALTKAQLQSLHDRGVRGVRFNSVTGDPGFRLRLEQSARQAADLGWHIQLFINPAELDDCLPVIRDLPVDVVIDHMGQIDPAAGMQGPAFRALMRALDTGRAWVKLTGYRCSHETAPYADLAPFVRRLWQAHGDRLLWGSNWPHPIRYHDMPEDGALLDALAAWLDDDAALAAVLVSNPARLYGFTA